MSFPLCLALATLALWVGLAGVLPRGIRRLRRLAALDAPAPTTWPRVSLVLAARNESATLGAAVPTMLALDYPDYEVIAVNDRSEDATGELLDRLATEHARLRVVHVTTLPPDWIGKNHALHRGAEAATGEFLLFTDADIHFAPDALRRAVAHAQAQQLDLLAAVPRLSSHGHLLGICVNAFCFAFLAGLQPWRIPLPRSRAHGSVGAFQLVRTAPYRRLGGHAPVRLRPDDDIKLGKLFKTRGARCEMLLGTGALAVDWYHDVPQMVQGLTKNAYAGADYRPWVPPLGAVITLAAYVWPLAALALTSGPAWTLNAASVVLMLALGWDTAGHAGTRRWHGLLLPVGMVIFSFILLRSQWVTHRTGGITWRGTHYPLRALRENTV